VEPPDDQTLHLGVDVVVLTILQGELCTLVVRRAEPPFAGRWALPGGPVRVAEDLGDAARRRLEEATGVGVDALRMEQLATYGDPDRDPRRRTVSVAWLAILPVPSASGVGEGLREGSAAEWVPTARLLGPEVPAFDHRRILVDGLERARAKLEYSGIATAFVDREFTIAALREVYEVVWGHRLDAGNFHRKVTRTEGFVVPTGRRHSEGRGRPAALFTAGSEEVLHPPLTRRSLE
jgi:8-oxo-dGTP diphosphatase